MRSGTRNSRLMRKVESTGGANKTRVSRGEFCNSWIHTACYLDQLSKPDRKIQPARAMLPTLISDAIRALTPLLSRMSKPATTCRLGPGPFLSCGAGSFFLDDAEGAWTETCRAVSLAVVVRRLSSVGSVKDETRTDLPPSGVLHDLPTPHVYHTRLHQPTQNAVDQAPQRAPQRDRQDPHDHSDRAPSAVRPARRHRTKRQEEHRRDSHRERAQRARRRAQGRDRPVGSRRDAPRGQRGQEQGPGAGEDAELRGKGVGRDGGIVAAHPRISTALHAAPATGGRARPGARRRTTRCPRPARRRPGAPGPRPRRASSRRGPRRRARARRARG